MSVYHNSYLAHNGEDITGCTGDVVLRSHCITDYVYMHGIILTSPCIYKLLQAVVSDVPSRIHVMERPEIYR